MNRSWRGETVANGETLLTQAVTVLVLLLLSENGGIFCIFCFIEVRLSCEKDRCHWW